MPFPDRDRSLKQVRNLGTLKFRPLESKEINFTEYNPYTIYCTVLSRSGGGGSWSHHRGAGVEGDPGLQRVHVQPEAGAQHPEPLVP
jgi:hypothetical protein